MYSRPATSLAYVLVPIATKQSGVDVDPTSTTVEMAFTNEGTAPVSGDWKTGSWETDSSQFVPIYYARCLVGPAGTVTLTAQVWDCYVRITDSPEIPVMPAGQIRIV